MNDTLDGLIDKCKKLVGFGGPGGSGGGRDPRGGAVSLDNVSERG